MPKVLTVMPKDIYVTIEFSINELDELKTGLALAKIDYDGKDPEQAKAASRVTDTYRFLEEFLSEVKRHGP